MSEHVFPNVIIAGTNKAGSTSLFRYLSDHPDVCPSSIKEVRFFTRIQGPLTHNDLNDYASYFKQCSRAKKVRIEASPNYLAGGRRVADLIHQCNPDVRLIFILREPVSRLLSKYMRRTERLHDGIKNLNVEEFGNAIIRAAGDENAELAGEYKSVLYTGLLTDYLHVFPKEQIKVLFFDDLVRDTPEFVKSVCNFVGINASYYEGYQYHVENKTRSYRSKKLHKLIFRTNMWLEIWLNRMPVIRRGLRDLYNKINEKKSMDTGTRPLLPNNTERLHELFIDHNLALGVLLKTTYPDIELPNWLLMSNPETEKGRSE